ncbi:MAG TPA: hemerythrin domain-containing protein [Trebonia sp.]
MPSVFEVLKQDHDEIRSMLAGLENVQEVSDDVTAEQLAYRGRLASEVVTAMARQEAVEQRHFWPAVHALGPDGERVAAQAHEQQADSAEFTAQLSDADAADENFEKLVASFASATRMYIAFEEAHAWPLLEASISARQGEELGTAIAEAKKSAAAEAG